MLSSYQLLLAKKSKSPRSPKAAEAYNRGSTLLGDCEVSQLCAVNGYDPAEPTNGQAIIRRSSSQVHFLIKGSDNFQPCGVAARLSSLEIPSYGYSPVRRCSQTYKVGISIAQKRQLYNKARSRSCTFSRPRRWMVMFRSLPCICPVKATRMDIKSCLPL